VVCIQDEEPDEPAQDEDRQHEPGARLRREGPGPLAEAGGQASRC
jgi:hypothetical protein